jgi:hypothetical protein
MKRLDLTNPDEARWYCDNFEVPGKANLEDQIERLKDGKA